MIDLLFGIRIDLSREIKHEFTWILWVYYKRSSFSIRFQTRGPALELSWDDKVLCWSSSNLRLILILKFVFEAWPCNCCLLLAWELHLPCIQKERKRHVYFLALLLSLKRHEALCNDLAFFSNSWHPQLVSSMTPFYSIERIDDSKWNQYTTEAIGCYRMIQSLCTMYPCK